MIAFLTTSILGSSYFTFVNEYSAYFYALDIGIRPPLEGIPYLDVGISAFSFFVVLSLALLLSISLFVARSIGISSKFDLYEWLRERNERKKWGQAKRLFLISSLRDVLKIRRKAQNKPFLYIFITPILVTIITFILAAFIQIGMHDAIIYEIFIIVSLAALASTSYFSVYISALFVPSHMPWVLGVIALLLITSAPTLVFYTDGYASLLRKLGYGGGVPMSAHVTNEFGQSVEVVNGYLLLRTTDALIYLTGSKCRIVEIPLATIRSIDYRIGAKQSEDWVLPSEEESACQEQDV